MKSLSFCNTSAAVARSVGLSGIRSGQRLSISSMPVSYINPSQLSKSPLSPAVACLQKTSGPDNIQIATDPRGRDSAWRVLALGALVLLVDHKIQSTLEDPSTVYLEDLCRRKMKLLSRNRADIPLDESMLDPGARMVPIQP